MRIAKSRRFVRLALLSAGTLLVVVFVARVGIRPILLQLQKVGPEVLWLLFPYAFGTALGAFPWFRLLPRVSRPSAGSAVASRFAASGANALLPLFGLAGEPARLLWLRSDARPVGLAAIVVDRVLYNSSSAMFLVLAAAVGWAYTPLPAPLSAGALATGVLILSVTLGLYWAALHFGLERPLQLAIRRLFGSSYADQNFGGRVDEALSGLLSRQPRELWLGAVVHFFSRAILALESALSLWILNVPVDVASALVIAGVPVATSLFASSIPSQLGVQEASQELVCNALGLAPGVGLAIVILQRGRQLVFVSLTPLLLASSRKRA